MIFSGVCMVTIRFQNESSSKLYRVLAGIKLWARETVCYILQRVCGSEEPVFEAKKITFPPRAGKVFLLLDREQIFLAR